MMETGLKSIQQVQAEIMDDFSLLPDWSERYEYIVEMGKQLLPLDPVYKTEAYLVKGCQSKVWLHAHVGDHRLWLEADSDAIITKGIIALLIRVFSGQTLSDIRDADLSFIDTIGLKSHLSPTRSNGLVSMIQHIRSYATHGADELASTPSPPTDVEKREEMIKMIKQVYDPEIPVDIWELGLIYDLALEKNGQAKVTMTLTSPACPVAGSLPLEVQERLMTLDFVSDVDLTLIWDPPWSKERMSDEARMALDMF